MVPHEQYFHSIFVGANLSGLKKEFMDFYICGSGV